MASAPGTHQALGLTNCCCTDCVRSSDSQLQTVQAQEQLLLGLRDHLKAHPALGASCRRLQLRLQEETCFAPRLDLTPQVLDILKAIPPTTWVIALHMAQAGSALYCAALKGQQPSRTVSAGKSKPAKQGWSKDGSGCAVVHNIA